MVNQLLTISNNSKSEELMLACLLGNSQGTKIYRLGTY